MKLKYIVSGLVCTSALLLVGCNNMNTPWSSFWHNTGFKSAARTTDAAILGEVIALDRSEMEVASFVKSKTTCKKVRHIATCMYKQHKHNMHEAMHLGHKIHVMPETNFMTQNIERHGQQEIARLNSMSDMHAFDRAYVEDLIRDHKEALRMLDHDIAHASNPKLVHFLQETRKHVAMHLQRAERLHEEMMMMHKGMMNKKMMMNQ